MTKPSYAGVGARTTPGPVLDQMVRLGEALARSGFVLRSGAAPGADTAFEEGCDLASGAKEIYLPWKGFNGSKSRLEQPSPYSYVLASHYHPNFNRLSDAAKKLMARNSHQILGADLLTPADFVLCYTENGSLVGGTAQAIRMAHAYGIQVINLGTYYSMDLLEEDRIERLDHIVANIIAVMKQRTEERKD